MDKEDDYWGTCPDAPEWANHNHHIMTWDEEGQGEAGFCTWCGKTQFIPAQKTRTVYLPNYPWQMEVPED